MKRILKHITFYVILSSLFISNAVAQIQVIRLADSDSTIVLNIGEIEKEAQRVAEEARKIAAEVQLEQMEDMKIIFKDIVDIKDIRIELDSLDFQIDQDVIEEQIRKAEEYVILQQEEIERINREIERETRYNVNTFISSFKLDYNGKIELNDDEDNIVGISRGGHFTLSKSTFGNKRKVVIKSDDDGKLTYKFFVGNSVTPFDPDGKIWLADILPEVIRTSTIAAESRIEKRMKSGGLDRVLDYIEDLGGSSVQSDFYKLLISRNDINSKDLKKITIEVTRNVTSSHDLASYFSDSFIIYNNKKGLEYYFNGIDEISSSYEKASCLIDIIENDDIRNGLSESQWEGWLNAAQSISSSYELSKTLRKAFKYKVNKMPARSLEVTLSEISSSYECAKTVEAAFSAPNNKLWNEDQNNALLIAAQNITSSYELRKTLERSLDNWKYWSNETRMIFFKTASHITSNVELASLLDEFTNHELEKDNTIHSFYSTAKNISSNYDLSSVLQAIAKSDKFNKEHYQEYLITAAHITSNYELSDALEVIAKDILKSKDETLIQLYKDTANKISSTYERTKAMEALQK